MPDTPGHYGGYGGTFEECVEKVSSWSDNPEGFCNWIHQEEQGGPPGSEEHGDAPRVGVGSPRGGRFAPAAGGPSSPGRGESSTYRYARGVAEELSETADLNGDAVAHAQAATAHHQAATLSRNPANRAFHERQAAGHRATAEHATRKR